MSQRTALVAAGALTAAAAWLMRRNKQGDEKRERAGSIAYDHDDTLFRVMRADAMEAADRVVQDPLPVGGLGAARGHLIEDLRGFGNPDHRAL